MTLAHAKYYNKRMQTDKEFHDKECRRIGEYRKKKYNEDPEYRELQKQKMREYYHRKKAEKIKNVQD